MKIQALTTAYTTNQSHSTIQSIHQKKEPTLDSLSIGSSENIITYSPETLKSKSYGERVCNYLDGIGYFEGIQEEDISNYKQEILSNMYFFKEGNINQAVLSLSDSLSYLRDIASSINNPKDRQDFLHFIQEYCKEEFSKINAYRFDLKQQELDKKAQNAWNQLQGFENEMTMLKEMAENSKEQCEAMEEGFDVVSKCFTIAMRILKGDHVPQSDHQFLLENDPDLYEMAVSLREFKEDPEDHDSVLDEEDHDKSEDLSTGFPKLETIVSEMNLETE